MAMIICANAVMIKAGKILLTREGPDKRYYFPGGKVGDGESLRQTLHRELREELGLQVTADQMEPAFNVTGPAYNQPQHVVTLNCFFVPAPTELHVGMEIHDYRWCTLEDASLIAPVVMLALQEHADIFNSAAD